MNYQELIISLILFIIALLLIAWWLASKCKVLEEELNKEKASNKFVVPVAEVKAQFSEEDMKKIRELLRAEKVGIAKPVEVEDESKKCTCDHFYDSVYIDQDIKHCCERLIFHCERCNHEEIIPIKRGLLTDTLIRGDF